jgi:hypothetical protein
MKHKWASRLQKFNPSPGILEIIYPFHIFQHLGTIFIACHCAEYGQAGPTNVPRLTQGTQPTFQRPTNSHF